MASVIDMFAALCVLAGAHVYSFVQTCAQIHAHVCHNTSRAPRARAITCNTVCGNVCDTVAPSQRDVHPAYDTDRALR